MTGKERLLSMLNNQPKDRVPWTTLVDDITRSAMSKHIQKLSTIDFYKHIGCDIFQFGNYGLNDQDAVKYPYKIERHGVEEIIKTDGKQIFHTYKTPWGILEGITVNSYPQKHPVETIDELYVLRKIWENTDYKLDLQGCDKTYEHIESTIGENGIYIPTVGPSALQMLLEEDIGIQNFYYMYADYPNEITDLIELIHDRRKKEYQIIAKYMPFIGCISVENTSTTYISPEMYRLFSQKHMIDFVSIMHKHNKKAILHMCGHVNKLLKDFIPINPDGIHALTAPPLGDTRIEDALDILGNDLFIVTGFGCIASTPGYSREKLWEEIENIVTPRLRESNVLFALVADGLPIPEKCFYDARDWFLQNG